MSDDDDIFELDENEKLTNGVCENSGYLEVNSHFGDLVKMLLVARGFCQIKQKATLAHALYRIEETEDQEPLKKRVEPSRRTKGDNRFENIMRGKLRVSNAEAEMLHLGLRRGFGDEIADAIAPEEFALMSPGTFHERLVSSALPWPDDKLSPGQAFEILALAQPKDGLSVKPAFVDTTRLPIRKNSSNETLRRIDNVDVYRPDAEFVLHLTRVNPPHESVLVFGLSMERMASVSDNETYCGFSLGQVTPENASATVDDVGDPFTLGAEPGDYALAALGVPSGTDIEEVFEIDPQAPRWSTADVADFVRALRPLIARDRKRYRLAIHRYRVH